MPQRARPRSSAPQAAVLPPRPSGCHHARHTSCDLTEATSSKGVIDMPDLGVQESKPFTNKGGWRMFTDAHLRGQRWAARGPDAHRLGGHAHGLSRGRPGLHPRRQRRRHRSQPEARLRRRRRVDRHPRSYVLRDRAPEDSSGRRTQNRARGHRADMSFGPFDPSGPVGPRVWCEAESYRKKKGRYQWRTIAMPAAVRSQLRGRELGPHSAEAGRRSTSSERG
jgi:hypothetical protein